MMKTKQRIIILNDIFEHFQQISQWLLNDLEHSAEYKFKAESLIELLEIEDCSSVGGFDADSPLIRTTAFKLYDRFLALVKKYDNENDIIPCCSFDLKSLGDYFKTITELRGKNFKK